MIVKEESFRAVYSELKKMFKKHHDEVNIDLGVKLNINFDLYSTLEHMNKLTILVARENKEPIGFLVAMINDHPHHAGDVVVTVDSFHVLSDKRRTGVANTLFMELQKRAEEADAKYILASVKAFNDASKFMEKLGFDLHEKVYIRNL